MGSHNYLWIKAKSRLVLFCTFINPDTSSIDCAHLHKVEKIKEDSLDLIPSPSPSVKNQVIVGKFTRHNKAQPCWVMSSNFLFPKVC